MEEGIYVLYGIRTMTTKLPPREASVSRVRVTYRDTDRMGHAYYANYLVWFEIGRTDLLRADGQTYREWEEKHGVYLPVKSCWVDYLRSAQYDDMLRIETRVSSINRASITFEYGIYRDSDGELLATGGTRHALVDIGGRIVRAADRLLPHYFADKHGQQAG